LNCDLYSNLAIKISSIDTWIRLGGL